MHHEMQSRNLDKNPDEVRKFTNGRVELANLGDSTIGRFILEPGWKWSKDVKPIVNTNSCQMTHTGYQEDYELGWTMELNKNLVQAKCRMFLQVMMHGSLEMSHLLQ
jgi:hypothetical protein